MADQSIMVKSLPLVSYKPLAFPAHPVTEVEESASRRNEDDQGTEAGIKK